MAQALRCGLLLAVAFAMACSADLAEAPDAPACRADSECPSGQTCQRGYCGVIQSEPRELGFTLIPPSDSHFHPQVVPSSEVSLDEPVTIGLESSVFVKGEVRMETSEGDATQGPSGVLAFARRSGDDPGFSVQTRVDDGAFEVFLRAGRYDVTLVPDDNRPTVVWKDQNFTLDTQPSYVVPNDDAYVRIDGAISPTEEAARIVAVAPDSKLKSTTATTDDVGRFELALLPNPGVYDLKIGPARTNGIVPEITIPEALEIKSTGEWVNLLEDANQLVVDLGTYQPKAGLPANVRFELRGEEPVEDWSGTTVSLESELGLGLLTLVGELTEDGRLVAQTDGPSGTSETPLRVLPGLYTVKVQPPPELPAASRVFDELQLLDIVESERVLKLDSRQRITGTVVSASGEPVPNTRVEMRPLNGGDTTKPFIARTDDDGSFEVWMEEREYRVVFRSDDPSLARRVELLEPDGFLDLVAEPIVLPEPAVVFGSVVGTPSGEAESTKDGWKPVPDVSIQAFERRNGRRLVLGEGHSDEDGEFRLVIPAE